MNPEAQRIAIAQACGWKPTKPKQFLGSTPSHAFEKDGSYYGGLNSIPDYLNSLDAMHEAEKVLTGEQAWKQIKLIVGYAQCAGGFPVLSRSESLRLHSATAAQRAEAFLRTIGKWEL